MVEEDRTEMRLAPLQSVYQGPSKVCSQLYLVKGCNYTCQPYFSRGILIWRRCRSPKGLFFEIHKDGSCTLTVIPCISINLCRVIQPDELEDDVLDEGFRKLLDCDTKSKRSLQAPKPRVVSKTALAKKLLNKKIVLNSRIVFDEDGEPVCPENPNRYDEIQEPSSERDSSDSESGMLVAPVPLTEFESSRKAKRQGNVQIGGIKIEKAQKLLRARDKVDRKRERERIR